MRDQVVLSLYDLGSVSGGGRGGGGFEPPPPPLVRPVPVGLLQRGYFIHTFFVCITGFLFASWFTNDVRLFGLFVRWLIGGFLVY